MLQENTIKLSLSYAIACKVRDYFQLMKFTLSFMVVFSCVVSYLMVPGVEFDVLKVLLLFISGMLVTGSANGLNQLIERDTDKVMRRTAGRPLASGRMGIREGAVFALVIGMAGLLVIGFVFNWLAALIALVSSLLYGFVYTPWKKWNSFAVLIGAVPGALPPLIGWAAGSGTLSAGGWALFAVQFFWQFPHFWAIAWVAFDDYNKAGFKLLPSGGGRNKFTAFQAALYTSLMIPVGALPYLVGISGKLSAIIGVAAGVFFFYRAIRLYRNCDVSSARGLMFGSYIYLPIVQLALLADKI